MVVLPSLAILLVGQVTTLPSAPVLQVGVFSYGPDGKPQAAAYATTFDTDSFQYIGLGCEIGGGNRPLPDRATDGWRVSGLVERMSDDEAVVRVDWQRVRSSGHPVNSPAGSVQLTLHPGDRVPLDSANPDAGAGCVGRSIVFEARFGPRLGWMGSGRGSGSGGGRSLGAGAGAAAGGSGGSGRSGSGGGDFTGATAVPKPGTGNDTAVRTYTAELFLVRTDKTHPEKPDFNLQGLVLRDVREKANFAFSPFPIETSSGPINIQIFGVLQVLNDGSVPSLVVQMMRIVRYSSGDASHDATSTATGSSTTKNPMPGPDDVLSFELPPIRVPNSTATVPDQYSVRVRIR